MANRIKTTKWISRGARALAIVGLAGCSSDDSGSASDTASSTAETASTTASSATATQGSGTATDTMSGTASASGASETDTTATTSASASASASATDGTTGTTGPATATDTDTDTDTGACQPDKVCGDECCADDQLCTDGYCQKDCGGDPPCGPQQDCCGPGQICYLSECITPGNACKELSCATQQAVNECDPGQICDPNLGLCVPSKADETCAYKPPVGKFEARPQFTWGKRKVVSCNKSRRRPRNRSQPPCSGLYGGFRRRSPPPPSTRQNAVLRAVSPCYWSGHGATSPAQGPPPAP